MEHYHPTKRARGADGELTLNFWEDRRTVFWDEAAALGEARARFGTDAAPPFPCGFCDGAMLARARDGDFGAV